MTLHHIASHQITTHHITSHRILSHHTSHITSITSQNMTPYHMTSPTQPHCFTSPHPTSPPTTLLHLIRNQPHYIIPHYIKAHHITTNETQLATTKKTPPDGTLETWCTQKLALGIALVGHHACIASIVFSPLNFRARLVRVYVLYTCMYLHIALHCLYIVHEITKYVFFGRITVGGA